MTDTEIIAALPFAARHELATATSAHVANASRVIRGMRRLGLVTDLLSLRNGRAAAKLTPAGEAVRSAIVARLDLSAGLATGLERL